MDEDGLVFPSFDAFVDLLYDFNRRKRSGMLFAATNANQMARIELEQGQIVAVNFMHKRGDEAVGLLTRIQGGRARFSEGLSSSSQRVSLPHTEAILERLDAQRSASDAPRKASSKSESKDRAGSVSRVVSGAFQAASSRISNDGAMAPSSLAPAHCEILAELLADYIGPVAAVIGEEHLVVGADSEAVLAALSEEIGDVERAGLFLGEARARLAKA